MAYHALIFAHYHQEGAADRARKLLIDAYLLTGLRLRREALHRNPKEQLVALVVRCSARTGSFPSALRRCGRGSRNNLS